MAAVACAPQNDDPPPPDEAPLTETAPDAIEDGEASRYTCLAQKDHERGLGEDALIEVQPVAVGGELAVSVNGERVYVGTVREVGVLSKADPDPQEFEMMLGMFHEVAGLTGVAADAFETVSSMTVIGSSHGDEEVYVVQMFDASGNQVGGSFTNGAIAAACLPTL